MIRKLVHYSIAIVFVFMFVAGPAGLGTALAAGTIFIDASGDGCGEIAGEWTDTEETPKTCKLMVDLTDVTIQIDSSGITLDGNGHTLSNDAKTLTRGVFIHGTNGTAIGVTVKNLTIEGFNNGITLKDAQDCFIRGNTIKNPDATGIQLAPISDSAGGGNVVTGNQILSANIGIYNVDYTTNVFIRNTIRSAKYALDGNVAITTFYNNNLIDNENSFFNANDFQTLSTVLPIGGNYWSSNDLCVDADPAPDGDGICDTAYVPEDTNGPGAGTDKYPWAEPNGWLDINITALVDLVLIGNPIEVSANFFDVDSLATHDVDPDPLSPIKTAVWDWGDGTILDVVVDDEAGTIDFGELGQHTYNETGVYELKLTMKDVPYLSTVVKTFQYVVIYDPSAGFVTGGGWIESPAGAYVPDPDASGQATFGFITKFYRTRTVLNLSGSTVFEFHAADLRFTSSDIDFLVVNESKAIYRGEGYIEGDTSNLGFMLTAQDFGDVGDKFRIQIWDADTSGLIYDNKIGAAANDMEAGTVIDSGSIIIQTIKSIK